MRNRSWLAADIIPATFFGRNGRRKRSGLNIVGVIATFGILMIFVAPVLWMIVTSLRPADEIKSSLSWPSTIDFSGFEKIAEFGFLTSFGNSLMIAVTAASLSVFLALLAAYGFSRRRFRGRGVVLFGVVVSQLFPFVMLVTPLYVIYSRITLIDTHFGIIIAYVAITLPFSVYMLMGYLDNISTSLDESAEIDGAGTFSTIFKIILPIAWPGVVTAWIYAFTLSWEEYLIASVLLTSQEKRTLPVALAGLFGEYTTQWDVVMAAGVVATVPTLVIFLALQRRLVGNLSGGSVK
jgi:ABC-type glycerol-3-phosphate transport system permease component